MNVYLNAAGLYYLAASPTSSSDSQIAYPSVGLMNLLEQLQSQAPQISGGGRGETLVAAHPVLVSAEQVSAYMLANGNQSNSGYTNSGVS